MEEETITGYTPSDTVARNNYASSRGMADINIPPLEAFAEFDRFVAKVKAEALREASEVYRSGQLTGIFMGRDDYPREWLLARAERIERGNA